MLSSLRRLIGLPVYTPLNNIYISKSALLNNYRYLSNINPRIAVAPVVKSNAYGHGLALIGKFLDVVSAPFFCVDSLYEAKILQNAKVKTPILIMGYIDPESLRTKKLPFSFTVFDLEFAKQIAKYQPGANVHIFVDTGMHREGIALDEFNDFIFALQKLNLNIEGLMSHLASADDLSSAQTTEQIENYQAALDILRLHRIEPRWRHISASSGLLSINSDLFNMARVGIALYGDDRRGVDHSLQPTLGLYSTLAAIKNIKKGSKVGYSATFVAPKNMKIGILPIGYNDGVDRRLSSTGVVFIKNTECPIIGRVSMNITTIDLTSCKNAKIGDTVELISPDSNRKNSLKNIAKTISSITHEVLIHLHPSIHRELVD